MTSHDFAGGGASEARLNPATQVPPHNHDAEAAIVSAVLTDGSMLDLLSDLRPEHFYSEANRRIFEAALAVHASGAPVDVLTVVGRLRDSNRLTQTGGAEYLADLVDKVPSIANVEAYARIVRDKWRVRQLMSTCARIAAQGNEVADNVDEWIAEARSEIERTGLPATSQVTLVSASDAVLALNAEWQNPKEPIPTGLACLDAMMAGGIRDGDVWAIGGAAKSGKSAFAGQIGYDFGAAPETLVLYASVEMPAPEVVARWVAMECYRSASKTGQDWTINYSDVLYGRAARGIGIESSVTREDVQIRLNKAMAAVQRKNLFVQKVRPGTTAADLRSIVRAARTVVNPKATLLIVDPVQRFFAHASGAVNGMVLDRVNANEVERIGMVAQQLKELADDEKLAIIFTSDSTKAALRGNEGSDLALRGSYQLNHLATTIFGVRTAETVDKLLPREAKDAEKKALEPLFPKMTWNVRKDEVRLRQRYAVIDCSGSRRGPAKDLYLKFVAGAMAFVEQDAEEPQPETPENPYG